MSFTVATANVNKALAGAQLAAAVNKAAVADVLCVQEAETDAHVRALAGLPGYTAYFPDGSEAGATARNACPVLWRVSRFDFIGSGTQQVGVGVEGVEPNRPANWVALKDKHTGGTVAVVSSHTLSGIDKAPTQTFPEWDGRNRRQESAHELAAIAALTRKLRQRADVVVGGADLNQPAKLGPQTVGADRVVYAPTPTHGRNWYDVVWLVGAVASDARVIATPSDHKVLVATVVPHGSQPPQPPTTTGATAADVVAAAVSQVGYHEGRSGGHWNNIEKYAKDVPGLGWANGQPWCDVFVCWAFQKVGALELVPTVSAQCNTSAAGWKRAGRWSEYPAVGAQVFYGSPSNLVHTGIVIGWDADHITTVEGNTTTVPNSAEGDGVYRKVHARRDAYVVGYGYPRYAGGIKSADPAYPEPWPNPVPVTRGAHVDAAMTDLDGASGASATRRGVLGKARALLASLVPWPKAK